MRRRKLRWVLAVGAIPLVVVGAFVLWPPPIVPGITQENFDRVEVGMTLNEVTALLGEPTVRDHIGFPSSPLAGPLSPDSNLHLFYAGKGAVCVSVAFDTEGKVMFKD